MSFGCNGNSLSCHNTAVSYWLKQFARPFVGHRWQKGGWAAGDSTPEEIIKVSFVAPLLHCIPGAPAGCCPQSITAGSQPTITSTHMHTHTLYICLHPFLNTLTYLKKQCLWHVNSCFYFKKKTNTNPLIHQAHSHLSNYSDNSRDVMRVIM